MFDGGTVLADPLTKRLWGDTVPSPVTSSGPTMLIHLHTDSITNKQGFTASYRATVKEHTGKERSHCLFPQPL